MALASSLFRLSSGWAVLGSGARAPREGPWPRPAPSPPCGPVPLGRAAQRGGLPVLRDLSRAGPVGTFTLTFRPKTGGMKEGRFLFWRLSASVGVCGFNYTTVLPVCVGGFRRMPVAALQRTS